MLADGVDHEEQTARRRLQLGGVVTLASLVLFVMLFFGRDAEKYLQSRTQVYVDFPTVTGLRRGSTVQLAGVAIGEVSRVDFVHVEYGCDPLTEDIGRYGQGRTDSCDSDLFCSPVAQCADLEPYAGPDQHAACDNTFDCADDEVCVTGQFRKRESKVEWTGPVGLCARFNTTHWRTRVRAKLPTDKLNLIRTDSRANVAANSVLGDQILNISPGQGDALEADYRIQARSSLAEDIEKLRRRIDRALENADEAMVAILNVINVLKDDKTMSDLKGMLYNLDVITRDVAYGEGLIGALLSSTDYRNDIGTTIHSLRDTARGLEQAADRSNVILGKVDRNIEPVFKDARGTLQEIDGLLVALDDPGNPSVVAKLLRDEKGDITGDLEDIFGHTEDATKSTASIVKKTRQGRRHARAADQ